MKILRIFLALAIFASSVTVGVTTQSPQAVQAAQTAPNTTIQNTASATYQDQNGTNYTTQSNTVTTLVGNAPQLTITTNNGASAGTSTDAPGQVITDTYTLTNTGNAAGTFQMTAAGNNGVQGAGNDNANTSSVQYIFNATTYTTIALLNSAITTAGTTAVNGTITVGVQYTLSATPANVPGTVTTQLQGNIGYAAVGGASAQTSANATNTYSDTIQSDARLDLQKSSVQGGSPYNITYTIKANDGGNFGAKALSAGLNNALGFPNTTGCAVIVDKVPVYSTNTPTIIGTPSITATAGTNGYPAAGVTTVVYYTTNATGAGGWTTTLNANSTYIAVFATVTSGGVCLNSHSGSSAGSVPAPAVTLSFVVPQPTGPGSGNAGSLTNIANGIVGDNQPTEHILGPGFPSTTIDAAGSAGTVTTGGQGFNNITALNGPSGASQITSDKAHLAAALFNGPTAATYSIANLQTSSQYTGSYDGVVPTNTTNDFTEASLTPAAFTSINSGTVPGTPNGNTYSSTSTVNVANALYNSGNIDDSYTVVATAPAGGWTVQLFQDNAGHTAPGTVYPGSTAGATSTATIALTSGSAIQYWAVYVAPSGAQSFVRNDGSIVATSVADGTQTNATHNEVYTGFVVLTKSVVVTSNGCPAGVTPPVSGACPGGVLTYSVDYRNIAVAGNGTEVANTNLFLASKTGTLVVAEDGAAIGNTWAANTNGLNAAAVDTPGTGGPWTSTFATNITASTAFTCTVGGAAFQLKAGWNGVISFAVTIK
jgi:hypothetical protein